jgi:hypothetical protein
MENTFDEVYQTMEDIKMSCPQQRIPIFGRRQEGQNKVPSGSTGTQKPHNHIRLVLEIFPYVAIV